jgi:hypothetical protein
MTDAKNTLSVSMDAMSGFDFSSIPAPSNYDNYIRIVHIAQGLSPPRKFEYACRVGTLVRIRGRLDGSAYRLTPEDLKCGADRRCDARPTSGEIGGTGYFTAEGPCEL